MMSGLEAVIYWQFIAVSRLWVDYDRIVDIPHRHMVLIEPSRFLCGLVLSLEIWTDRHHLSPQYTQNKIFFSLIQIYFLSEFANVMMLPPTFWVAIPHQTWHYIHIRAG
jgi:hypothetical protein